MVQIVPYKMSQTKVLEISEKSDSGIMKLSY